MNLDRFLSIGSVVKAQGLKGEIKFKPWGNNAQRFFPLKQIYLKTGDNVRKMAVISSRFHKNMGFALLVGPKTREDAKALIGSELMLKKADIPDLPKDEFYLIDLIDCKIFDENHKYYGKIKDVLQPGGSDVYIIRCNDGDYMIPAVKRIILNIDIDVKTVTINSVAWGEMAVKDEG